MSPPSPSRPRLRLVALAWAAVFALSCKPTPTNPDATAPPTAPPTPTPTPPTPQASTRDASSPATPTTTVLPARDAGAPSCKLVYGPQPQTFRGAVALAQDGPRLSIVANDGGKPRVSSLAIPPRRDVAAPAERVADGQPIEPLSSLPCELAGKVTYCPARSGLVRRFATSGDRDVGTSRPGTRIAAASIGADESHAVVAFLVEKSGGGEAVLQAFVALDDGPPVRLSEDGGGATQLALVSLGDKVLALYLDARMAMTPIHARELTLKDGKLALGPDAVLSVGGPAERGVSLGAGRAGSDAFALVPLPTDVSAFGMATLKVPSPPRADVPVIVSPYANGLDPAPFAATRSGSRVYVARVVPESAARGAMHALELGRLAPDGAFVSYGLVARGSVTDVALLEDTSRTLWAAFGDGARTWVARFACP